MDIWEASTPMCRMPGTCNHDGASLPTIMLHSAAVNASTRSTCERWMASCSDGLRKHDTRAKSVRMLPLSIFLASSAIPPRAERFTDKSGCAATARATAARTAVISWSGREPAASPSLRWSATSTTRRGPLAPAAHEAARSLMPLTPMPLADTSRDRRGQAPEEMALASAEAPPLRILFMRRPSEEVCESAVSVSASSDAPRSLTLLNPTSRSCTCTPALRALASASAPASPTPVWNSTSRFNMAAPPMVTRSTRGASSLDNRFPSSRQLSSTRSLHLQSKEARAAPSCEQQGASTLLPLKSRHSGIHAATGSPKQSSSSSSPSGAASGFASSSSSPSSSSSGLGGANRSVRSFRPAISMRSRRRRFRRAALSGCKDTSLPDTLR
mmetsp:Transcript_3848/g.9080  ORF Transcript_3848/g.9080 Transcript_3848/m.9080 type:complete len:385 (+) Transcript_3848:679-1833(+)